MEGQNFEKVQSFPLTRISTWQPSGQQFPTLVLNSAALAELEKFSACIASEKRFQLKELTAVSAQLALPIKMLTLGLKLDRFGNEIMNENLLGLQFAKKLSPGICLGMELNYYSRRFGTMKKHSAINAGLGLILHLSDQLVTGVHIYNPTRVQIKETGERLPYRYSMGLGYSPSGKIFLVMDLQKTEGQPVNIHCGVHYYIVHGVSAGMGITSAASSFYLAIGYRFQKIMITVSAGMHPIWAGVLEF